MIQLPSTQQLRYFLSVAESLSFRKAAENCSVSQSTISGAIRDLEECLGIQLLERTKRKVRLTEEGEALLVIVRDVFERLATMRYIADAMKGPLVGGMRMGVIPTIAPFLLPEIIGPIREEYPHLDLRVVEDLTPALLEKLHRGEIECAVVALPYNIEGLLSRVLCRDALCVAMPRSTRKAGKARRSISSTALQKEKLLLLQDGHCLKDQALTACRLTDGPGLSAFRASSLMTLARMVEQGEGVTFIPKMAVRVFERCLRNVDFVPLMERGAQREICVCWREDSYRRKEIERLSDFIADCLPENTDRWGS